MKSFATLTSVILSATAALLVLTSCGNSKPVLNIYNWGDYLAEDVIKQFEKEYNCVIKMDEFDSNESMYAKLKAGAGGYDLIVPSAYAAKLMQKQDMLETLDHDKLPNVMKYYDNKYTTLALDPELSYTVPYFVSFTGIGYLESKVKDFKPSWKMFEREDLKGRTSLLNDQREVVGCALRALGYEDVNERDQKKIDEAVALAKVWKKQIAKFGVDDVTQSLASGEFLMIHTYSGNILQVSMENPDAKFVIPEEGSTVTFDCFAILKDAKEKDLAYKFIDFIYRPEVCAENMNEIQYVTPHKTAVTLVNEDLRNNPAFNIPQDQFDRCCPLQDLGDDNALYTKAWDKIRQE